MIVIRRHLEFTISCHKTPQGARVCVISLTSKGPVVNNGVGGGGYKTGGQVMFYPYRRKGGGKGLTHAEGGGGGTQRFEVVFNTGACSFRNTEGAQTVSTL